MEMYHVLNSYAYDFFNHGIESAIERENCLKSGQSFAMLKDFMLVLQVIFIYALNPIPTGWGGGQPHPLNVLLPC